MKNYKNLKYIFFGTGPLAESALYTLYQAGLIPSLVITSPNKVSGRNLLLKENIIATWCKSKNLKSWQPETLKNLDLRNSPLGSGDYDLAIVASYPKILSPQILNLPIHGTLNIHPSLLPLYRGPSPIQTALLNGDNKIGISIIKLDKEVDHGPILIQKEIQLQDIDTNLSLEKICGQIGAELIIDILESYLESTLKLIPQDHERATFTYKFNKSDGEISLEDSAIELQNKYRALLPHIPIFFFIKHKDKLIRVKITEVNLHKNASKNKIAKDIILKVIPEGKSEITFENFKNGYL